MHGLLADEALHVQPQLIVLDQRQGVLERLDDELLTRRQQQVQDVAEVGGEGLVGHVVERQLRPVEFDVARLQDDPLVIERGVVWTRRLVVDREHRGPPGVARFVGRRPAAPGFAALAIVARHCVAPRPQPR